MKFDFARLVDQEFSELVWTGSDRVNQMMDAHERKALLLKRCRKRLIVGLVVLFTCMMIALL